MPPPKWLLQLATICVGKHVTEEGDFVSAGDEMVQMEEVRRELAALRDDAPYVEWGRWFFSDSSARSIAPGFTITQAQAEKLAKDGAAELEKAAGKP